MRILVATDFSPGSQRAVRRAGILAQQTGADLMLMHVVDGAGTRQVARDVREAQRMTVEQAAVAAGGGVTSVPIRLQYLRGFGFSALSGE